ncbi:hypothetical protein [Amycolatopsis minnesotensis]|uniref:Uncharacterized protein n=1 Tax=Amycolatopsis minnesotensis TaxID=337894 RepID=A0ABN2SB87_9PSEU
MNEMARIIVPVAAITAWLVNADVAPANAAAAAVELAECWADGDLDYQTARDVLGDHLTDDEPRPKLLADDLAAHFGITLKD